MKSLLARALASGTLAAAAVTVGASLASRRATGSYPAAINATSHVLTDYHLVPRPLTPGFELRLPRLALVPIYAALAVGLSMRDVPGGAVKR